MDSCADALTADRSGHAAKTGSVLVDGVFWWRMYDMTVWGGVNVHFQYGPPEGNYNRWKRWSDMGIFAPNLDGAGRAGPPTASKTHQSTPPTSKHIVRPPACG
jgi:hypothetical protein